ncbi:MAG: GDP-mannose 4,6-dehydratase, partial [Planctomycetota bacterium]
MTSVSTMLITGGAGFVGSAFCRAALEQTPRRVVVFDALTYAGRRENLDGLEQTYRDRFAFMHGDIRDREAVTRAVALWSPDVIVNLAAESHVDRSIQSAGVFVATNVTGVQTLVDVVRSASPATKFIQVSTDEVYGALPLDDPSARFTEQSPLAPRSPYAASKAGGDCLALAAHHTHGLDVVVTRCANNMGPRQFPEKLVPRFITRLLEGKPVPVYGDGRHVRDWMHVDDHADGLLRVIERGTAGGVYHLGAGNEISNLDLTHA